MIYLTKFLLHNTTLKLRTSDAIHNKESLQDFLIELQFNLNHNLEESYSYKFNTTGIDIEVKFPKYFIDFIAINKNLSKGYEHLFIPFLPFEVSESIEDFLIIKDQSIIKKKDIVIDTSFLRRPFLIDYFNKYLNKEQGFNNYLIEIDNYFIANGEKEWVIAHASLPGTYGIKDECLLIEDYEVLQRNSLEISSNKIILSSESACINKMEYSILPELHTKEEFELYSESNNISFIILDKENKYYQF